MLNVFIRTSELLFSITDRVAAAVFNAMFLKGQYSRIVFYGKIKSRVGIGREKVNDTKNIIFG